MSTRHTLDPHSFPLFGSRLIEASAGTGKTWTIAALYVRLVLGHQGGAGQGLPPLLPQQILVMTFTRAATRELSDRIRARLVEAAACFRGERSSQDNDPFLQRLLQDYPDAESRTQAAWQLAMAAECMDDAAIFTIDAWCQRMLREHAFDSGHLFDETLESDEAQRLQEAAQDYWRQQCYPLQGTLLQWVLKSWKNFDAFFQDLCSLQRDDLGSFSCADHGLEGLLQEFDAQLQGLVVQWQSKWPAMRQWVLEQSQEYAEDWKQNSFSYEQVSKWVAGFDAWLQQPATSHFWQDEAAFKTGWKNLGASGMRGCRKKSALPIDLPAAADDFDALAQQMLQMPDLRASMLAHAAADVNRRMQWLKQQARSFGFADMLVRLDRALAGEQGAALRARILQQYPVAMVDEFQDTSPLQYRLFDQIYCTQANDPSSALLLIGDPKQSIYGFRGADIHSYMRARTATQGRHYVLATNFRSTHGLVQAVNHWFDHAEQRWPRGAFLFRRGDATPLPFEPVAAQGRDEVLHLGGKPSEAMHLAWYDAQGEAVPRRKLQQHMAQACAAQIVQWLNRPDNHFVKADGTRRPVCPNDIAILVRNRHEARLMQRALHERAVATVYLSDRESVFASAEAQDLLYWLRAVAAPRDVRAVRAGLATRLMGLSLQELAWLSAHDEAFDAKSWEVAQLHQIWQTQGVLAMLRQTLHRMDLPARWLREMGGERRLTNYLHLAELLQNASATLEGEQALLRWFAAQLESPGMDVEEQIVRLESDADLVKIVTVHKSKGLEYPIVCLPFAMEHKTYNRSWVAVRDEAGNKHITLTPDSAQKAQADDERLQEDVRLFYVALTRPRYLAWIGLYPLNRKTRSGVSLDNHSSCCGYLLNGGQKMELPGWQDALQALAHGCPDMRVQSVPSKVPLERYSARQGAHALCEPQPYQGRFDTQWSIASFSRLVRGKSHEAVALPGANVRAAEDEHMVANTPMPVVRRLQPAQADAAVWHRFMRGELVGNFIHEQLEWLESEDFALEPDGQGRLAEQLLRRCERAGRAEQAQDTLEWLRHVVHHALPPLGCTLAQISTRLPEMEFWLPVAQLPARQVDALCRQYILPGMDRPVLPERSLHGMLMGFADLVFSHQGRYWVLDYKSNYLGVDGQAYHAEALESAMLQHRYDVQAALYMLALDRLLDSRLGAAYVPQQHLGGALYFFLRGLDGPAQGVHVVEPALELLRALHRLMNEVPA